MDASRRTFIRTGSGAALAYSWGGLDLFAGEAATKGADEEPVRPGVQEFIYGAHVYRPPNPPREMRREVLRTIAQEHHFGLVRCFPTWDYYNPSPGKFEFQEVEEFMTWCDEFGLKVMVGVVLETAPHWLEQAHPESRYVDSKGQPKSLMTKQAHMTGGWPGLCLDWAPVQDAAREFIAALSKVVTRHRSMFVWDVWNEPHIEPVWTPDIWATPPEKIFCYCPKSIAIFREWLKARYVTLDCLNQAWTRRFQSWESVDPPHVLATSADWVDWRRFMTDRSTWDMQFRCDAVRASGSKHLFESHAAHHPPFDDTALNGTNGWRLAECVDVWGMTYFPHQPGFRISDGAGRLEIIRSNAAGKDFWWTEMQGGDTRMGMLGGGFNMRPRDIRLWNWLGVAAGAKGIIYWQYMAESTGRESTRHGLVLRDNASTDRVREAAHCNQLIQKQWGIIKDYRPKPQVALLFDPDNALLTFAMAGEESASTSAFLGYYRALWKMDLWAAFIEPSQIAHSDYKVIIVPWHWVGKKTTCDALLAYTQAGGTLILETAFGLFDERFYYNAVTPPHGLSEAFGYREKQNSLVRPEAPSADVSPDEMIYYQPELQFTGPVATRFKARRFVTPLEVTSATAIGSYQGNPIAVHKKIGKGEMFYFGTALGACLGSGDANAVQLFRTIMESKIKAEVTAPNLRPRILRASGQSLLTVFNDTPQDQNAKITLPPGFTTARDIYSGVESRVERDGLQVAVPYEDVSVFVLT
jgi:beta-galactosidase